MPQDIGDDYRLADGKALKLYNATSLESEVGLRQSKNEFPERSRIVYTRDIEYGRLPVPVCVKQAGAGATTGTAGDKNLLSWPHLTHEYCIIGTQTTTAPSMALGGLDLGSMTQTSGQGLEVYDDLLGNGDTVFVTGTSPAFFVEYTLNCSVLANIGTLYCGLRKVAAVQQVYTSYTDYAGFLLSSGNIHIKTRKASGTAVDTDTTQTMTASTDVTVRIIVDGSGNCYYTVNGTKPTVLPATLLTWTAGTSVMPFIEFIYGGSSATTVVMKKRKCGYLI